MNQVVIMGMIFNEPICSAIRGKTEIKLVLSVNGDKLPVKIVGRMGLEIKEHCVRGDTIGVKGKLINEDGDIFVSADKVTFLCRKEASDEE